MQPSANSAYEACLKRLFSLHRFGIKLGLATIRTLLAAVGNPHEAYPCIHIAGTNGKGSVAAMMAAIIASAGYKVGMYTSPHLVAFNERIRINGVPISNEEVLDAYEAVNAIAVPDRTPTFFEFTTAMALLAFQRRRVDWAVIETGMGGRLDATNVVTPSLSIITNISVEHREYLGDHLKDIAFEKAGIIKAAVPVITGARQRVVRETLQKEADARGAPLHRLGRDFKTRRVDDGALNFYGRIQTWRRVPLSLTGNHQQSNAALALAGCETLMELGALPDLSDAVHRGMSRARWPGRLEVVSHKPLIVMDGAHNLAAVRALAAYMDAALKDRPLTLVVGILDDKPYRQMLAILASRCTHVIVTRPMINRALPPDTLRAVAEAHCSRVSSVPCVADAVAKARAEAHPDDAICIAGSLYVVGEAKAALDNAG